MQGIGTTELDYMLNNVDKLSCPKCNRGKLLLGMIDIEDKRYKAYIYCKGCNKESVIMYCRLGTAPHLI